MELACFQKRTCYNIDMNKSDKKQITYNEYLIPPTCPLCWRPLTYNQKKHTMVCIPCGGSRDATNKDIKNSIHKD